MVRVGRVLQVGAAETFEQEGHALEAVAAVAVAGVRQEADHRLVDLHAAGRLRAIGRDRALRALRRDRAGAVGDQQAGQDLQRTRLALGRPAADQREAQEVRHGPAAEPLLARNAAQAAVLVVAAGDRGADHHAVQAQVPRQRFRRQARDAFAHQRAPGDGGGDGGQDGVARDAPAEAGDEFQEDRAPAARAHGGEHGLGPRVVGVRLRREEARARFLVDRMAPGRSFRRARRAVRNGRTGRSAPGWQASARSTRLGPMMAAAAAITVLGEFPASRAASAAASAGIAHQVDLGRDRDVEHHAVLRAGDLVHQRQGEVGFERLERQVEHRVPVHRCDLRGRVHRRGAGRVLHVLARR